MDTIDLKIVDILQADGRVTMKELGQRVGLTSPATIERVKKLEESGIIGGYKAIVNIDRAGLPVRVFILLTTADVSAGAVAAFAENHSSILQCHRVAGGVSHLLEGAMADLEGLERLLDELAPLGQAEPFLVLSSPVEHKAVVLP
ncbi:MAG: Lrp/AsnC family transcriptional regulator [Negativicutes bacterium]|nr:Lrp/AsnC family transcriptional regulator [Negativicutes bacterium]